MQALMKRSETIIENEDYVKAKQPLVYMQVVLDLILAAIAGHCAESGRDRCCSVWP